MKNILFEQLDESFDVRSNHGKRFKFKYFFLYLIMAELAGANSARKKELYLQENRRQLGLLFDEHWHEAPKKSAINNFINSLDIEKMSYFFTCFASKKENTVHMDGKTIRASGANLLNLFTEKTKQCVGQFSFAKGKEIECVYNALKLGNFDSHTWVTLDALHCQKKLFQEQNN